MVFSGAGGNALSIADVDAAASTMQVQLSVTNGTLTLSTVSGLSFSAGDGTADAAMTFTGTISAVNTALNGLTFTPTNQVAGTAMLQIVTSDQGATGAGGALTDSDTISISIINAAPTANNDTYSTTQGNPITVAASGVLANDTDANSATQTLSVQSPRPVIGPSHGTLTLNADGSFTYTPTGGYTGSDSFTYKATDGIADSAAATVTITITTNAYVSSSGWSTSFSASRYLDWTFPGYVPAGSVVEGGTFRHTYRSYSGGTTCYYFEVWSGGTLIGTHGSSSSPVSCATTSYVTDIVPLPEINTAARANAVTVRLFVRNSASGQSEHATGNLGITYYLGNP
jgi:VCBS repeat-containing protein